LDKTIKKHIRILVEKYNHTIKYHPKHVNISNDINTINIVQNNKYNFDVDYNEIFKTEKVQVPINEIYDILLDLLIRNEAHKIEPKTGEVLSIEDWVKEEDSYAKSALDKLRSDLKIKPFDHRDLGGNRFELCYYKGLIILTDDLCLYKSNVIEI